MTFRSDGGETGRQTVIAVRNREGKRNRQNNSRALRFDTRERIPLPPHEHERGRRAHHGGMNRRSKIRRGEGKAAGYSV